MIPLTEPAIRTSFVNCTKGEVKRLAVPKDLDERPWEDLEFFGWPDASGSERAYLVAETNDGLVGVALRVTPRSGQLRRSMCSICLTTHVGGGVSLMTARKAGPEGRQGNSVGAYMCADLACSLHLRGKQGTGRQLEETLTLADKVERTRTNLATFLQQVRA